MTRQAIAARIDELKSVRGGLENALHSAIQRGDSIEISDAEQELTEWDYSDEGEELSALEAQLEALDEVERQTNG